MEEVLLKHPELISAEMNRDDLDSKHDHCKPKGTARSKLYNIVATVTSLEVKIKRNKL